MANEQQGQGPSVASAKTLIERQFQSVNLSTSPTAMRDGECAELDNLMPYAPGNLAVMAGPKQINTAPAGVTISEIWTFVFGTLFYIIVQGTDGSINIAHASGTWTQLAAAGSTTVNGLHMIRWNGADAQGNPDAVLWVDVAKGYGRLTTTTWTVMDAGITGQCLAVYAGRVWIGTGSEVVYTAPGAYNDFNAADYAGSFKITDSSFNGAVIGLYATQNWLYIVGSGMMALNNVQVQSVAGSTTLVTTYYLTPVSASVAISNDRAALVYDAALFITTNSGLWAFFGLNGKRMSESMGDNFNGTQSLTLAQVYGKNLLTTSAGYVFMVDENQWFTTLDDVKSWVSMTWLNDQGIPGFVGPAIGGYAATATAIYQIGQDTTTARTCTLTTKLYDAGNASINKQVLKMGIELFPNELIQPLPTSFSINVTETLLGYVSQSQTVNMLQSVSNILPQNMFLPTTVNMMDRYFSMNVSLTCQPGMSIGGCFFQFMDSTPWPNRNIVLCTS